jgi:hypothetical protein
MHRALLFVAALGCASGPVAQRESCEAYVACVQARDAEIGITTDATRFEPGGACWGNPEIADLCDRACANGLDWLRGAVASLPEECR